MRTGSYFTGNNGVTMFSDFLSRLKSRIFCFPYPQSPRVSSTQQVGPKAIDSGPRFYFQDGFKNTAGTTSQPTSMGGAQM